MKFRLLIALIVTAEGSVAFEMHGKITRSISRGHRTRRKLPFPAARMQSSSRTTLAALPWTMPISTALSRPSVLATTALLVSTSAGYLTEALLSNCGILTTLITAATLSNLGWVPSSHTFYDICWSWFLPASLALLLLSFKAPKIESEDAASETSTVSRTVRSVSLPFAIGSIGSFLGCLASWWICWWKPSLWLSPADAAVAAGCLCASYIGGSVNFFHAATILSSGNSNASLLSSMAAADLMVMAIYFAFLSAAVNNRMLRGLFEKRKHNSSQVITEGGEATDEATLTSSRAEVSSRTPMLRTGIASLCIVLLAGVIVAVSNRVEAALADVVPGTGCAVIALLASAISRRMPPSNQLWTNMRRVGSPLSQFSFLLLFASVGVSANLGEALRTGPACLWFSLVALCVHVAVTLIGSLLSRPLDSRMQLDDVLVASNAAIGGPATAAAFAGTLNAPRRQGLVVAATVWGVVGYAIATGIGVFQARLLQRFL